jgi:septum formation protein
MTPPLILASQSPRRIELLKNLGLKFEIIPASVEETTQADRTPEENALAIASLKATHVARGNPGAYVLGADTLVVLDGALLGKPHNAHDADHMLHRLSGRTHKVITAVVLIDGKGVHWEQTVISTVNIKPLTDETIHTYIATGEPLDKAGAYAIQGRGADLVDSWSGSWSNIVGLPTETVCDLLKQAGYPLPPTTAQESSR